MTTRRFGGQFGHLSSRMQAIASVEKPLTESTPYTRYANYVLGQQQITPEQAQALSPEVVQQLATHAEKSDPTIVDKASAFYAQHSSLVKTLGGAALTIALAKVAERQRAA